MMQRGNVIDAITRDRMHFLMKEWGLSQRDIIDWYTTDKFTDFTINRCGDVMCVRVYCTGMITER